MLACFVGCKPATTPLPKGTQFCSAEGDFMAELEKYRCVIGRFIVLGIY